MTKKTKYVRELCALVEDLGVEVVEVYRNRNNHYRFRLRRGGVEKVTFFSATPSDRRSTLNWKMQVRRSFGASGASGARTAG